MNMPNPNAPPLKLFSVVIPARDEAESLPATIEHLHLELSLNKIPHEIVAVDDGSRDRTWEVLQQLKTKIPELRPRHDAWLAELRRRRGGHHDGRRIRRRARRGALLEIAE
jgi:glycosyltransferase involved in cell wall biosynthesis